jgi:hypothetical protein
VTQLGVEAPLRNAGSPDNPAEAISAVVDSVGALARAELRLAATEARAWLVRIGLGLVLLWLSLSLIQVFALLLALSPVLFVSHPWPSVALMLVSSLGLVLVVSIFAVRELRRLKDVGHEANDLEPKRH